MNVEIRYRKTKISSVITLGASMIAFGSILVLIGRVVLTNDFHPIMIVSGVIALLFFYQAYVHFEMHKRNYIVIKDDLFIIDDFLNFGSKEFVIGDIEDYNTNEKSIILSLSDKRVIKINNKFLCQKDKKIIRTVLEDSIK